MPARYRGPIVDHHCHLSPQGDGVEAARRFARAGGTHLFLATQQYGPRPPLRLEEYEEQFVVTERLARSVTEATGVAVFCVVAPFPPDLIGASAALGLGPAVRLHEEAIALAGRWARERRAVALGEVGRPHFPVPPDVARASESLFRLALETARESAVPAVVHSEDLDAGGYLGLAELAARAGLPPDRVVKHYARAWAPPEERAGVVASFLAHRALAARSLGTPGPWFWETDYLDDPRRPGAVLDLATIPRRVAQLASDDDPEGERFRGPFETSVRTVYGLTLSVDDRPSGAGASAPGGGTPI